MRQLPVYQGSFLHDMYPLYLPLFKGPSKKEVLIFSMLKRHSLVPIASRAL